MISIHSVTKHWGTQFFRIFFDKNNDHKTRRRLWAREWKWWAFFCCPQMATISSAFFYYFFPHTYRQTHILDKNNDHAFHSLAQYIPLPDSTVISYFKWFAPLEIVIKLFPDFKLHLSVINHGLGLDCPDIIISTWDGYDGFAHFYAHFHHLPGQVWCT